MPGPYPAPRPLTAAEAECQRQMKAVFASLEDQDNRIAVLDSRLTAMREKILTDNHREIRLAAQNVLKAYACCPSLTFELSQAIEQLQAALKPPF